MALPAYRYRTLKATEIRLLHLLPGKLEDSLHCHLEHVDVLSDPKYETISYAWGDPKLTEAVQCDESQVRVTTNLHTALRHLRHENEMRVLWADAICINQADTEERAAQVALMGKVYARSQGVLIWIGEETDKLGFSIDKLLWLNEYLEDNEADYPTEESRWKIYPDVGSTAYPDLETMEEWKAPIVNFLSCPWFARRWVLQELALSTKATIICGHKSMHWVVMAEVMWSLHKAGLILGMSNLQVEDAKPFAAGLQAVFSMELVRRDLIEKQGSELLETVISTRMSTSLDPRDVLFSVMGVACDLPSFEPKIVKNDQHNSTSTTIPGICPDYSVDAAHVYHHFVVASIVNKGSILPLSSPYVRPQSCSLDVPTWVPDFSDLCLANPLMYMRNESRLPFKAAGDTAVEARFSNDDRVLHLMGYQFDTIKHIVVPMDETIPPHDALQSELNETQMSVATAKKWLSDMFNIIGGRCDDGHATYGLTNEAFESFGRTVLCDLTCQGDRPDANITLATREWLDTIFGRTEELTKMIKSPEDGRAYLNRITNMDAAIGMRSIGWCFCTTEQGRMGRCLKSAQPGDRVVLFNGGQVPYALRRRVEGGWNFVTSLYIHGIMDGEGMQFDLEKEEFAIY